MDPDLKTDALQALIAEWRERVKRFTSEDSPVFWVEVCADELSALLTAQPADVQLRAKPDYVDWGSGELLAMTALDNYPIDDGLPKSTSVVFRIHQLGRAYQQLAGGQAAVDPEPDVER